MMEYEFELKDVCATKANVRIDSGRITGIRLTGGCAGQGKALSALAYGMTPAEFIRRCGDITCGNRETSCSAEVASALRRVLWI